MGQSVSVDNDGIRGDVELVEVPKEELIGFFHIKCKSLLRKVELKAIATKTNITNLNEKTVITPSDLAYLLQLCRKDDEVTLINQKFGDVVQIIYDALKITGSTPFLRDFENQQGNSLTIDDLIVNSVVYNGKLKKVVPDYDTLKVLFVSLSYKSLVEYSKFHAKKDNVDNLVTIKALKVESDQLQKRLIWKSLAQFKDFDGIDINDLYIDGHDLHQLLTLFLLLSSIPPSSKLRMESVLYKLLKENWGNFEESALSLLKYMDININSHNMKSTKIKYDQFFTNEHQIVIKLLKDGFTALFETGFLSSNFDDTTVSESQPKESAFSGSKLMNNATISSFSTALKAIGSETQITTENLIKLYIGKEAGFSIRSLELKIFKWQAPTLFIVSGKRLKSKTVSSNKRYLQFDNEYPRYFRSVENPLKDWQLENDRITYGVLVSQPWRTSNKKNFGDTQTTIFSLSPHFDFYKSSTSPILKGESIYFNTLGLGLGFGNEQPINKNGVRKYLPGDVSLTIESNLEFAVFRHLSNGSNSYFKKSQQHQLSSENFEDRFMITDLEVWGVGSTKELELQKKQWEWENKQAELRQSVNLKTMGEDRAFLEMVGLVGNHGGSGGSV